MIALSATNGWKVGEVWMMNIRCDFPLGENTGNYVIVQNTSILDEVHITVVNKECADYEFLADGEMLIKAIRKCIERI